jgi:hypothetical protein
MPELTDLSLERLPVDIDAPERVNSVIVSIGTAYPWHLNKKACICRSCEGCSQPGSAVRLVRSGKHTNYGSGFICITCLAEKLFEHDWHWNPLEEQLGPIQKYTQRPVSGPALARAFIDKGERGLFWVVTGGKRPVES